MPVKRDLNCLLLIAVGALLLSLLACETTGTLNASDYRRVAIDVQKKNCDLRQVSA